MVLVDLAQGDGISFDILEIEMEKKGDYLKLNEIVAHGPSMSVIIEEVSRLLNYKS